MLSEKASCFLSNLILSFWSSNTKNRKKLCKQDKMSLFMFSVFVKGIAQPKISFWRHPFTAEDILVSKWCIIFTAQLLLTTRHSLSISISVRYQSCRIKYDCNHMAFIFSAVLWQSFPSEFLYCSGGVFLWWMLQTGILGCVGQISLTDVLYCGNAQGWWFDKKCFNVHILSMQQGQVLQHSFSSYSSLLFFYCGSEVKLF